uniref:TatC n=1 Tax=Schizocladia ischiensis TaxID=196139 RepID=A0A7S6UA27_9STRA|nr:tatC [Schizocladia ischiensis]QOW07619.1 tatC [Schizocladia ischiensis]
MQKAFLSFSQHLQEFKYRFIYTGFAFFLSFSLTYAYKESILYILLPKGFSHFLATQLTEVFFSYLHICTLLSLFLTLPFAFLQAYLFLRPGLYFYESQRIGQILKGAFPFYAFIYTQAFPFCLNWLWDIFTPYNDSTNFSAVSLNFEPRLEDFIEGIGQFLKVLSLSFPCLLILLYIQQKTKIYFWIRHRSLIYLLAFSLAALLTPPDVYSQLLLGLVFIILFEIHLSLWSVYLAYGKKSRW